MCVCAVLPREDAEAFVPDMVCGDLDSAPPSLLSRYARLGTAVVQDPDQGECCVCVSAVLPLCAALRPDMRRDTVACLAVPVCGEVRVWVDVKAE